MELEIVRLLDVVREMYRRDKNGVPVPFSITFVTCDLRRGTGGEKITMERAVLVGGPSKQSKLRDPGHDVHFTRNIKHADGDRIIKVHPPLITRFNGRRVAQ